MTQTIKPLFKKIRLYFYNRSQDKRVLERYIQRYQAGDSFSKYDRRLFRLLAEKERHLFDN